MKNLILVLPMVLAVAPLLAEGEQLKTGTYFVKQSWSQEKNYQRPYLVSVPKRTTQQKLPVFLFLHGKGGNAKGAMNAFIATHRTMQARYVMVFPNGYRESWNVVSEDSKADDRGFIEEIVKALSTFDNVQPDNFSIMGNSNGAAMVNQLAIESTLPNIRSYVTAASQLNVYQYDGKNFKAKGNDNNYEAVAKPMTGKRLMNISGTRDELIPYRGGPSLHIPDKEATLAFIDAEESIFLWAKQMGYTGKKLPEPNSFNGKLAIFNYLSGDVIHYKVLGQGHGASNVISEKMLLSFLEGKSQPAAAK